MAKFPTGWLEAFTSARPGRRLLLTLLVMAPFAALIAAYLWLHQPPYSVLFRQLSDQAGGEVMAALEQLDIPYRLAPANGAIEVPADQLYSARFKLAARGVPKPATQGASAADTGSTFGLSQFQEQLRYQHALEAELVQSVESLDAVLTARVHLALPKTSPFLRDPPPVTAAVLVQLHPHRQLNDEQVSAIQRMVAASVPRLKPTEVSVLDQHGELLGTTNAGVGTRPRALETDLERRVGAVLSPWFPASAIKAHVTATLLPDGRIRRLNAAVIVAQDASPDTIEKATQLARQALGFDARRGDSLSVFALPPPPLPKKIPEVRVPTPRSPPATAPLPWLPVTGAALLLLLLVWQWMRRRATVAAAETPPDEVDDFDNRLQAARRQTLANPRVTADVIRLWMRA